MKKPKTYYLTLSQTFPATHPRKGEPTGFVDKIQEALNYVKYHGIEGMQPIKRAKLHTLRGNYNRWYKIFEQIYAGEACLSLRVWSGKPYRSKMIEIARLTKDDGIGIQKLEFKELSHFAEEKRAYELYIDGEIVCEIMPLATNDGLSYKDWQDWFRNYDLSQPLAIIHFTNFRY